jgi:hypothetical protein
MTIYSGTSQTGLTPLEEGSEHHRQGRAQERSVGELLSDLTQDLMTLVRQEMTLVKTEMSQKMTHMTQHLGMLMAGGALAYAGVLVLVASLVLGLIQLGWSPWVAALVVGALVTGGGAYLVKSGIDSLRKQDLTPHQTIESLTEKR